MRIARKLLFPVRQSTHWTFYCSLCSARSSGIDYNVPFRVESFNRNSRRYFHNGQLSKNSSLYIRNFRTSSCNTLPSQHETVNLSKHEVNTTIWENEHVIVLDEKKGLRCETNQLASNRPNEDQLFITRSHLLDGDLLFGVIDGHNGPMCGKVIRQRLPYYFHSALCTKHFDYEKPWSPVDIVENLLGSPLPTNTRWTKDLNSYLEAMLNEENAGHSLSYVSRLRQLILGNPRNSISNGEGSPYEGIAEIIKKMFNQLDSDITNEIKSLAESGQLNSDTKGLAESGCCALVAYLMEDELFIANVGDCRAILGTQHNGSWKCLQLTVDHAATANSDEVQRILGEHPDDEARTCIQYGRLLGHLAPLRAFGDIQFKLTKEELESVFKFRPNYQCFKGLLTPPYLTAEPEVFHYKIDSSDKFIVLASDGLWDMLSNEQVMDAVAAYIEGRHAKFLKDKAHFYGVANCDAIINDENAFSDSANENVASFLIRYALGGYDEENLRSMLAIPYPDVRWYRDDITVIVLLLNNYLEDPQTA